MKTTKLFAAALSALILCANSCVTAFAEEFHSGNWYGLDWTLENHVLTISGEGEIYTSLGMHHDFLPEWNDYNEEIQEIVIQEGVTGADEYALTEYPNLKKITLPESFVSLGVHALADNPQLVEINGLEYVQEFDYRCLSNTAYIEENPFIIINNALYYAEGTSLTVPDGVTEIKAFAFGNLTGDDYIDYPGDSLETTENNCTYYEITLPDSVQKIDDYAFAMCATMTGINIPDSVQSIGNYAFYNCVNLNDITLGENLNSVGTLAFFNCKNIHNLTILNPETEFAPDAFGKVIDWDKYFEQDEEISPAIQRVQELYPNSMDEMLAYIAVHFWNTNPYSEIKENLANPFDEEEEACLIPQGSITGHIGSTAQKFARKNQLAFIPLEEVSGLPGDVDLSGKIDILDVITLNRAILGKESLTPEQELLADFNQDGKIDPTDSLAIMRCIVGLT